MLNLRLQTPFTHTEANQVSSSEFIIGYQNYWRTVRIKEHEYAMPQSFCWLYCWAKNGYGASNAGKEDAREIFLRIFDVNDNVFDNETLNAFAHEHRYDEEFSYELLFELDSLLR